MRFYWPHVLGVIRSLSLLYSLKIRPRVAGGEFDREILDFDGQFLILRWIDPGAASRYGMHGVCTLRLIATLFAFRMEREPSRLGFNHRPLSAQLIAPMPGWIR